MSWLLRRRKLRNTRICVRVEILQVYHLTGCGRLTQRGLYLVATLYDNACEHCKDGFQRIGIAGGGALSGSSLAARTAVKVPPGNKLTALWYRILKSSLPTFLSGRPTTSRPPEPDISTEQVQTSTKPSNPIFPEDNAIHAQYLVKFLTALLANLHSK